MSEELFDKDHFVSSFNKKIKKLMPDENDEIYEYLCLFACQNLQKILLNQETMSNLDKQFAQFFSDEEIDIREKLIRWLKDFLESCKAGKRRKQNHLEPPTTTTNEKRRRSSDHVKQNQSQEQQLQQENDVDKQPEASNKQQEQNNNGQQTSVKQQGTRQLQIKKVSIADRIKPQPKKQYQVVQGKKIIVKSDGQNQPEAIKKPFQQQQQQQGRLNPKQQGKVFQKQQPYQVNQQTRQFSTSMQPVKKTFQQQQQQLKKQIGQQQYRKQSGQQQQQKDSKTENKGENKVDNKQKELQQQKQEGENNNNEQQQDQAGEGEKDKKKIKCRFYPGCKNPNCEFHHPTEECKFLPHCKFGQSCMNKHPQCQYGTMCSRPNCFYEHPPGTKKMQGMNPYMYMMPPYQQKMMMGPFVRKSFGGPKPGKPAPAAASGAAVAAKGQAKPAQEVPSK